MKPSGRYSEEEMKGKDCVNEFENKIFQHGESIGGAVGV